MPSSRWKKMSPLINELLTITSKEDSRNPKDLNDYFKICEILMQVQKIEPEFEVTNESRLVACQACIDWVTSNGGYTENISVHDFGGMGFGLKANNDLLEGQLICTVPQCVMLTAANLKNSLKYLRENDPLVSNMDNVALALLLVMEYLKGSSSFWHPYIQALPRRYTTVLYWPPQDLAQLKGSPAFEPALKICKSIARQYAYFKKLFETCDDEGSRLLQQHFSYQLYRWGVSTIMTRQNSLPHLDTKIANALIPLWDMCNHANGKITTGYNGEESRCECLAPRNFKKNEQIFIFYGTRSNAEFLLHNGFVYPDNEFDTYRLHLGISTADRLFSLKSSLLKRLNIQTNADFYLRKGTQPLDRELVAFLRVFNMDQDDLVRWLDSAETYTLKSKDYSMDVNLENKVWSYLATRIKLLLSSYTDTAEKDVNDDENLFLGLIRLQKILEKNLLLETVRHIEKQIKL